MKKIVFALLMGALTTVPVAMQQAAAAAVEVTVAKPLFDADGKRLGVVYRVATDGSAQLIIDDKLFTVPVATLSVVDGKQITSLTRRQITSRR